MKIRILQLLSKRDVERVERDAERIFRETEPMRREAEHMIRSDWFRTRLRRWQEWRQRKTAELWDSYQRRREVNRANAAKPRRKRGPSPQTTLKERGLWLVLRAHKKITAGELWDILDAEGRMNFDEDDLELRRDGNSVLIRDLAEGSDPESTTIEHDSLSAYLSNARKTYPKLSDR